MQQLFVSDCKGKESFFYSRMRGVCCENGSEMGCTVPKFRCNESCCYQSVASFVSL